MSDMSYSDLMSASTSSSFVISDMTRSSASDRDDDVDSLPSISSSILDSEDDDDRLSDAQREWEASLEQLQLLLTMIVMPFAGKFLGRKFAYWSRCSSLVSGEGCANCVCATGWARYMEWMHNVEIRWTNKRLFNAAGAVEAAATL
jgi:hypothetical protein